MTIDALISRLLGLRQDYGPTLPAHVLVPPLPVMRELPVKAARCAIETARGEARIEIVVDNP